MSSDHSMLARLRAGDAAAFKEMYDRYADELFRFADHFATSSRTADDLVHDVMLWIWEHRETLDVGTSLRAYLLSAVRRRALHVLRHERIAQDKHAIFGDETSGIAHERVGPDAVVEHGDIRNAIQTALAGLAPAQRMILSLRWNRQLTYPEIAEVLGISVDAAKQQVSRLQRVLQPVLDKYR